MHGIERALYSDSLLNKASAGGGKHLTSRNKACFLFWLFPFFAVIWSLEKQCKNEKNFCSSGAREDIRIGWKISYICLEFGKVGPAAWGTMGQRCSGQWVQKSVINFISPSHKGCCYVSCHYCEWCLALRKRSLRCSSTGSRTKGTEPAEKAIQILSGFPPPFTCLRMWHSH